MAKIERIREKYTDDRYPNWDWSRIEISLANEDMDTFLKTYAPNSYAVKEGEDTQRLKKRKERLLKKIFKAAALSLTDRQFQIFTLRHVFGLKETDIANQLDINQSYIPEVLKASHYKIRKLLRLEAPRPRRSSKTPKIPE